MLFGWNLQNLNNFKSNIEAIDLIDKTNKFVVQVSSISTKFKVESALSKNLSNYNGYTFKFISISKSAKSLRNKKITNPSSLNFNPQEDIFDIHSILNNVTQLAIEDLHRIYTFIKEELGTEADPLKLESNLAEIINILSRENLNQHSNKDYPAPFAINEKIACNELKTARAIIDDYNIHYARVSRIYGEFDKIGCNKSLSVLNTIRREYLIHKSNFSSDELFFKIIECVAELVINSANFSFIPTEELDLCVNILVVDAFIRCKIFINPEGYNYASP